MLLAQSLPSAPLGQIGKACRFAGLPGSKPPVSWASNDPCIDGTGKPANAKVIERQDGKIVDNSDVIEGIVLLQKGNLLFLTFNFIVFCKRYMKKRNPKTFRNRF